MGLALPAPQSRWLVAGQWFLPDHRNPAVVGPDVPPRGSPWDGHTRALGVRIGHLALPRAWVHSPGPDG